MKDRNWLRWPKSGATLTAAAVTAALALPGAAATMDAPAVSIGPGTTSLTDIGFYSVQYRYFDGRVGEKPIGWTGDFDRDTGIALMPVDAQGGKSAFLEHPIWRNGGGDTLQTYRFALPKAAHVVLKFSIAMKTGADAPGKSDGVTFRVRINGKTVLDRHKTDATWSDYSFDLASPNGGTHAGKSSLAPLLRGGVGEGNSYVTVAFETDPGPARNSSFDFGVWGDRRIEVIGASQQNAPRYIWPADGDLSAPRTGWGGTSPRHTASAFVANGIRSVFADSPQYLFDGCVFRLPARQGGASIPFAADAVVDLVSKDGSLVASNDPSVHASVTTTRGRGGSVQRTAVYTFGGRTVTVHATIDPYDGGSARVRVWSANPFVAAVHFGSIGPTAYRRALSVPYLGQLSYHQELRLFSSVSIDFTRSHSSGLEGATAVYSPLTDGRRNPVDETAYYALSPSLASVLPTPPGQPSPYRKEMASRVVLDLWGAPYHDYTQLLGRLDGYGIRDFLTILHVWQNGGYDNKLPDVLPANAGLGGDAGLRELTAKARSLGQRIALHENYVDFYPNAASYNEDEVARGSDGTLTKAWINLIQSYLMTPSVMLKYAARFTPKAHRDLGTNASYLDVHSAIPPWAHVDFRADGKVPRAGSMEECWKDQRALWQYMRTVHGGPILGEGSNHWYWSGMLDGVEAQFGLGRSVGQGAPLFVDFDLLQIHPRQMNHGMGYVERWLRPDHSSAVPTQTERDEYRAQEIAYGHSPFVGNIVCQDIGFVWTEHNLVLPASRSYATAHVTAIGYEVAGKMLSTEDAIAAGSAFDRVRIAYDNGTTVWANTRPGAWRIAVGKQTVILPQYGWYVVGPTSGRGLPSLNPSPKERDLKRMSQRKRLLVRKPFPSGGESEARAGVGLSREGTVAGTTLRSGHVCDYSETPTSLFASTRLPAARIGPAPHAVAPSVTDFRDLGHRRFLVRFHWKVGERIPAGYVVFVHITDARVGDHEGIVSQMGAAMPGQPSEWIVGQTTAGGDAVGELSAGLPDGEYRVKAGLYDPDSGPRLALTGEDDGGHRYTVARLILKGDTITLGAPPIIPSSVPTPLVPIDFGKVVTDGSILMKKQAAGTWTLYPFPRDRVFHVRLKAGAIDPKLTRVRVTAVDANHKDLGTVSVVRNAGWTAFTVNNIAGAVAYRVVADR